MSSRGALFNIEASELCYRSDIVDHLLSGVFKTTEHSIWFETGEIENEIQKLQLNDAKKDTERS